MIRKKNNNLKRYEAAARASLRNFLVAFVAGNDQQCDLINAKTSKVVGCGLVTARALTEVRFKWSVLCAVICRTQDGQEYMKTELFTATVPYLQSELSGFLNEKHQLLLKTANKLHLCTVAWIGCPSGNEITEQQAAEIFTNLGAWEFKTDYENDKNKND